MKQMIIDGELKYYVEKVVKNKRTGRDEVGKYFMSQDERSDRWMINFPTEDGHMALQECDENGNLITKTKAELEKAAKDKEKMLNEYKAERVAKAVASIKGE